MKLLIASNNKHKIEEIKKALAGKFDKITSFAEENIVCEPEENGATFLENALIKAHAAHQSAPNYAVIADDTGLCVRALDGMPGVHSARYAGDHNSCANRQKLLRELKNVTDRSAYFQTAIALIYPTGEVVTADGTVEGRILENETGDNGFGYDSIFYCDELHKSFAQATMDEKLQVSHRGRALRNLLNKL